MRPSFRDLHRREFPANLELLVCQRFRKRLVRVLPALEPHRVPPQFLRLRTAVVLHPVREAGSPPRVVPHGVAAAGAAVVQQARRRDTRQRVAAEHTLTDKAVLFVPIFLFYFSCNAGFQDRRFQPLTDSSISSFTHCATAPRLLVLLRDNLPVAFWQMDPVQTYSRIVAPRLFVIPKLDAFE